VSDVSWCVHGIGKDELRLHCSAVDVDGDALTLRIRLETDECRARAQCFERSATFPARAFQNEVGFSVENPLDPVVTLALKGELTCTAEDSRGNVDSRTRPIANVGATWCN
jgi:hypothetical protein